MCGICGFIHKRNLDEAALSKMNNTMIHRGPDDAGVSLEYLKTDEHWQLGMAQRRLSILDLSELGHQPMESADKECIISYNGEIYNFKEIRSELEAKGFYFKSNCDTEVILAAYLEWGIDCIQKFNGMFAISLFDRRTEELYLVRDRIGVKPLYYYKHDNELVFASELKPIMSYPFFTKDLDMNALGMFLCHGYITGKETIFTNTCKLEPGHYLRWTKTGLEDVTYWNAYDKYTNLKGFEGSYQEAIEEFERLLNDSVEKRMISDVPLGAFLSGGYDSTLISAVMQRHSKEKIKTFTIGFDVPKYDESAFSKEVADFLGTEHHCEYLRLDDAKKIITEIPKYYDEPMADSSQVATMLLSDITKKKVTVALSGDAGDELFGGYTRYRTVAKYNKRHAAGVAEDMAVRLVPALKHVISAKNMQAMAYAKKEYLIDFHDRAYWKQFGGIIPNAPISDAYTNALNYGKTFVEAHMLNDTVNYLPEDILTKVDRASMRVSLETRCPLLDYRIVEFALSLPQNFKIQDGRLKAILKDLTYKYVDRRLLERPKTGFGVPVREWLRDDLHSFSEGLLTEDYINKQGIFNWKQIKMMEHMLADKNDLVAGGYLWHIFVFQMWYEEYLK